MHSFLQAVLAIALLCTLSGFYVSDGQNFTDGECASQIAGTFSCEVAGNKGYGRTTESKSGLFKPTCTYQSSGMGELTSRIRKVSDRLYLQEAIDKTAGATAYQWFEMVTGDLYNVFLISPNAFGKVNELIKVHGVRVNQDAMSGQIKLIGPPEKVAAFLLAHDRSMLAPVGTCRRER